MHKLSSKQMEILDFINTFIEKYNYPPTFREIGKHLKLRSSSTIYNRLNLMRKKGVLSWEESKPRTIALNKEYKNYPVSV